MEEKACPFGHVISRDTPSEKLCGILELHDRLLGTFIRLFGTTEALMTGVISRLAGAEPSVGQILTSKAGAGQKISLLRQLADTVSDPTDREFIRKACKEFAGVNDFRIKVSHQTIGVLSGVYSLMKQGPNFDRWLGEDESISEDILKTEINRMQSAYARFSAINAKLDGTDLPLEVLYKHINR